MVSQLSSRLNEEDRREKYKIEDVEGHFPFKPLLAPSIYLTRLHRSLLRDTNDASLCFVWRRFHHVLIFLSNFRQIQRLKFITKEIFGLRPTSTWQRNVKSGPLCGPRESFIPPRLKFRSLTTLIIPSPPCSAQCPPLVGTPVFCEK